MKTKLVFHNQTTHAYGHTKRDLMIYFFMIPDKEIDKDHSEDVIHYYHLNTDRLSTVRRQEFEAWLRDKEYESEVYD